MKLFINLSNHPSSGWTPEQMNAALEMVDNAPVIDMQFPLIDPEMNTKEVQKLAKNVFIKICKLINEYDADQVILHVMGEMCFTYKIVEFSKQSNSIICVASTTKRVVSEDANRSKVSKFEFVQFRKY